MIMNMFQKPFMINGIEEENVEEVGAVGIINRIANQAQCFAINGSV